MLWRTFPPKQQSVYFAIIFPYFSLWQFFFLTYYIDNSRLCSKFQYLLQVKLYSQLLNGDIIHIIYLNCIYTSWTAIARLIISQLYSQLYSVSKCQFLTRPNVLIVLLGYIDLFQFKWQHEMNIWEGLPYLYHFILLYLFLKHIAIVTN